MAKHTLVPKRRRWPNPVSDDCSNAASKPDRWVTTARKSRKWHSQRWSRWRAAWPRCDRIGWSPGPSRSIWRFGPRRRTWLQCKRGLERWFQTMRRSAFSYRYRICANTTREWRCGQRRWSRGIWRCWRTGPIFARSVSVCAVMQRRSTSGRWEVILENSERWWRSPRGCRTGGVQSRCPSLAGLVSGEIEPGVMELTLSIDNHMCDWAALDCLSEFCFSCSSFIEVIPRRERKSLLSVSGSCSFLPMAPKSHNRPIPNAWWWQSARRGEWPRQWAWRSERLLPRLWWHGPGWVDCRSWVSALLGAVVPRGDSGECWTTYPWWWLNDPIRQTARSQFAIGIVIAIQMGCAAISQIWWNVQQRAHRMNGIFFERNGMDPDERKWKGKEAEKRKDLMRVRQHADTRDLQRSNTDDAFGCNWVGVDELNSSWTTAAQSITGMDCTIHIGSRQQKRRDDKLCREWDEMVFL